MTRRHQLLVVDDDAAVVEYLVEMLEEAGYAAAGCTSAGEALALSRKTPFDLVITDVEMPEMRGIELMKALHAERPGLLVILITAFGTIELAVRALREGAVDFVTKPFLIELLLRAVERALRERRMRREIVRLRRGMGAGEGRGPAIVARSRSMQRILALAERSARVDTTLLVTGESGVGKGVLARHVHDRSGRAGRPFVAVNCAAIPATLIESELFGARRGAFTDARADRAGLFEQASGGTLFLDEVAEMPLELQAKLLHALETQRVRPLGATTEQVIDVRLIAATNADLEARLREGRFRPDLYYRLNVIRMDVPPLRERQDDIEPLIDACLQRACDRLDRPLIGVSEEVLRWAHGYAWPGNVRELANVLERAVALAEHDVIVREDLAMREEETAPGAGSLAWAARQGLTLEALGNRYIRTMLEETSGNKARAATRLGIDRRTLYRRLDETPD